HYDGTCTNGRCQYQIVISDSSYRDDKWTNWIAFHGGFRIYEWLGGRAFRLIASFTVWDGKILREEVGIIVAGAETGNWYSSDEFPLALMVQTKSRSRLRGSEADWWIMGSDEQLADHPYYKAGRPGGCEINCEEAVVTYSTRTPNAEIECLTSFNFSC